MPANGRHLGSCLVACIVHCPALHKRRVAPCMRWALASQLRKHPCDDASDMFCHLSLLLNILQVISGQQRSEAAAGAAASSDTAPRSSQQVGSRNELSGKSAAAACGLCSMLLVRAYNMEHA